MFSNALMRAVAGGVVGTAASCSWAQTITWTGPDGSWFDADSWDAGEVPADLSTAIINNGNTVAIEFGTAEPYWLFVGFDGVSTGANQFTGPGRVVQTDGVLRMPFPASVLLIGEGVDGAVRSSYELSGGAMIEMTGAGAYAQVGSRGGDGLLHVRDGARATFPQLRLALFTRATETELGRAELIVEGAGTRVTIDGAGERVNGYGDLTVGEFGPTRVTIRDGALVEARTFGFWSADTGEVSTVDILGEGTVLRYGNPEASTMSFESAGFFGLSLPAFVALGSDPDPGALVATLDGGARIEANSDAPFADFTIAGPAVFRGNGVVQATTARLNLEGRLEPGVEGVGELVFEGEFTGLGGIPTDEFGPGVYAVDLASTAGPGVGHDRITATAVEFLGGTLEVALIDGFTPARGDVFEIITITDQLATFGPFPSEALLHVRWFTGLDLPDLYPEAVLRPRYTIEAVELVAACPADLDLDGDADMDDIDLFVEGFVTLSDPESAPERLLVDLDFDGARSIDDIARFIEAFLTGCDDPG